jgi:glycosyltransferase involved in cell wall biosynthesis
VGVVLSILICSLECRARLLARLLAILEPQVKDRGDVEVIVRVDDGAVPIGAKRNALLDEAVGEYVAWIDDDDLVSDDYVASLLDALGSRPDCVGFRVRRFTDGKPHYDSIHSLRYTKYDVGVEDGQRVYYRSPNHLCPIRRDLALQARFPEWDRGEDATYAVRVRPLLKTEVFIDRHLYSYMYVMPRNRRREITHKNRAEGIRK